MKAGRILLNWLNVLFFLCAAYFCAAVLLLWYNFQIGVVSYQFSMKVPLLGNSWLPAPLWFCVVISLVTIALAVICVYIRCRIGPLPVLEKERVSFRLPNLNEHMNGTKRIKTVRNVSFVLFLVSVLLVAIPALTALPVERFPPLRVLFFDFMDRNIRKAVLSAGYGEVTSWEISLLIIQSAVHQCILFFSSYWFFLNLRWKQLLSVSARETGS